MSTAHRLIADLRALLAEFRSPEHGYWLTSACADRLEAVLTEHAPEVGSCANQLAGWLRTQITPVASDQPEGRICPQDGSVCWDSCAEGYCQGIVDGKAMADAAASEAGARLRDYAVHRVTCGIWVLSGSCLVGAGTCTCGLDALATSPDEIIIALRAEKTEAIRKQGVAMWAALDVVREHIGSFENWPDALKTAFADAIIDHSPLTTAEIARTQELAKKYGWETR